MEIKRAICTGCGEDYPLYMFPKNKNTKTGHDGKCKQCAVDGERPMVTQRQADWGVTVPQEPEIVWEAMQKAFGRKRFSSLNMKRQGAYSSAGQWL